MDPSVGERPRSATGVRARLATRHLVPLVGALLVWSSLGFVGYAVGWTVHQHRAGARLVATEEAHAAVRSRRAPCVEGTPSVGQLEGILQIPSIGLDAPVEEGTGNAELAVAVGHAPASVLPGASGTAVLLAHDVSYFVHIGELRPGAVIRFVDQCATVAYRVVSQQVVAAGAPVENTPGVGTLVLDTCWPTNALFFTSHRLLVTATEVATTATGTTANPIETPAGDAIGYTVPAPPALVAEGLTLTLNEAPMGTMTLTGDPSPGWVESPGPLALEAASLEAYFGGIHATAASQAAWWAAIAPGVPMPAPLIGAQIVGHDTALDVTIDAIGGTPRSVTLTTEITVAGGRAPGEYLESVTTPVDNGTVTIGSWEMSRA
ncbi:MAG: sortase [Actinomycetota bacterium]|nr:sortase [Actinomycetota bacterium]MDA8342388.1 sortase [Actinomycetota bacterium]